MVVPCEVDWTLRLAARSAPAMSGVQEEISSSSLTKKTLVIEYFLTTTYFLPHSLLSLVDAPCEVDWTLRLAAHPAPATSGAQEKCHPHRH